VFSLLKVDPGKVDVEVVVATSMLDGLC
jgi:hypothetical protein